ncbi:MAG: hypothetical protein K6G94_09660 [Kiritimatiellae bacterium]|nr:hypothetical protein [Kiritimatiellia bacterium]
MAADTSFNKYFCGRVVQREYTQEFDFEFIPNWTTVTDSSGNVVARYIASYTRNFVTAKAVEQVFRFEGLTRTKAFSTTSDVAVTDLDGNSYSFDLVTKMVDGSSGSRVLIVEEVSVERTPMSPHMWEMVVTRRGYRYYVNGSAITLSPNTPSWASSFV